MKYFYNTSWMFAEQMLRMIVGVLVGIWVARYLGPEQFGIFSYALAFTSLFSGIAKLGLDNVVVRDLVNEPDNRDIYLGTAFWLKLIGAFITLGIVAFATLFTSNDHTTNLYIFIIASGIIFQPFEVIDFYFQSKVLSKYVSLCKITQLFLSSTLKLYFILTTADLFWFVVITLVDQAMLAISLCLAYKYQKSGYFYNNFDLTIAKILLNNSWPIVLASTALMIQSYIDQVMLKEMVGNVEVGYYSVAMRLILVFGFIPSIIGNSLFPALVKAKNISKELYQYRFLSYYRLSFFLFLITAIPIFIFSEEIVILLFGYEYKAAGALLSLMAVRLFFANMGVARGIFINIENIFKYSLVTMIFGTIANIALNYYLIPFYQGHGAITATIISFFVTSFLIDFFYYKTRENVKLQIKGIFTFYKLKL